MPWEERKGPFMEDKDEQALKVPRDKGRVISRSGKGTGLGGCVTLLPSTGLVFLQGAQL